MLLTYIMTHRKQLCDIDRKIKKRRDFRHRRLLHRGPT